MRIPSRKDRRGLGQCFLVRLERAADQIDEREQEDDCDDDEDHIGESVALLHVLLPLPDDEHDQTRGDEGEGQSD